MPYLVVLLLKSYAMLCASRLLVEGMVTQLWSLGSLITLALHMDSASDGISISCFAYSSPLGCYP
eukprot:2670080-Amphidinium_carterae.1